MASLRVATYNTRDFLDDRAAAARVVRAINPDILCLQEVPRRLGSPRRVAAFARACGLTWIGRHRGSGGTTILVSSRVEIVEAHHHRLPVALLERTRGYAVAHLRAPGWPKLLVASVHLGLRPEERQRHGASILGRVTAGDHPAVTILAGDLNEDLQGPTVAQITATLQVVSPPAPTYPVWRPDVQLDVIFGSANVHVVSGGAVALCEADVRAGSDHRPVWVDLEPAESP